MLRALNPNDETVMDKNEFMKRLKLFDQSLTTKEIETIADKFSKDKRINYELVK